MPKRSKVMSDGAIYAALSRAEDPEGYDAAVEHIAKLLLPLAKLEDGKVTAQKPATASVPRETNLPLAIYQDGRVVEK